MTTDYKYQPVALDSPTREGIMFYYSNNVTRTKCVIIIDTLSVDEMALDSSKRITRKWEVFAGRNRFYCNGRLMTAPHSGVFVLTVCLITGTSILFFIFE